MRPCCLLLDLCKETKRKKKLIITYIVGKKRHAVKRPTKPDSTIQIYAAALAESQFGGTIALHSRSNWNFSSYHLLDSFLFTDESIQCTSAGHLLNLMTMLQCALRVRVCDYCKCRNSSFAAFSGISANQFRNRNSRVFFLFGVYRLSRTGSE